MSIQMPQHQDQQPGIESAMCPEPEYIDPHYKASNRLLGKVAIITGGDSGIGRAISVHYAREGAKIVIVYLNEHDDAQKTKKLVEESGQECLVYAGDVGNALFCEKVIDATIKNFRRINILVNNAGEQHIQRAFEDITEEQLMKTFKTNIFSYFFMVKAALPYMKAGDCIINTSSAVAYSGSEELVDYAATEGAILAFTRSLSQNLMNKKIRVNAVAPGPVWTPMIPASLPARKVEKFGLNVPMRRAAQPKEIAPSYVFLASKDASYFSGEVFHPNGGELIGV